MVLRLRLLGPFLGGGAQFDTHWRSLGVTCRQENVNPMHLHNSPITRVVCAHIIVEKGSHLTKVVPIQSHKVIA